MQAVEAREEHARARQQRHAPARVARPPARLRSRPWPRDPVAERDCWRSARRPGHGRNASAGPTPNAIAVATVISVAKPSTTTSNPTSSTRGTASRPSRSRRSRQRCASPSRAVPRVPRRPGFRRAADERAVGCRGPVRLASANSCTRPVARASTRFATFTQATSEDEHDRGEQQPQRTARGRHQILLQRNRGDRAQTRSRKALLHRLADATESSARACSRSTPFRSRPTARQRVVLLVGVLREVVRAARRPPRRQSDLRSQAGAIPTTSYGSPLSRIVEPINRRIAAEARAPQRVAQHDATCAGLVARARSPGRAVRPIAASGSSRS